MRAISARIPNSREVGRDILIINAFLYVGLEKKKNFEVSDLSLLVIIWRFRDQIR